MRLHVVILALALAFAIVPVGISKDDRDRDRDRDEWRERGRGGGLPALERRVSALESDLDALIDALLGGGPEPAAAFDYFLKIDGVDGESNASGRDGSILVSSFHWGLSNAGTRSGGGGVGPEFTELVMTKPTDKSSPALMLACAQGTTYEHAELFALRGAPPVEYLRIQLTNVTVTAYNMSGTGASEKPVESLSLNYEKIGFEYKEVLPDGSAGAPSKAGWDLKSNRPV